MTIIFDQTP